MSKQVWKQIEWSECFISSKGKCRSHKWNLLKPVLVTQWYYAYKIPINWTRPTRKIHRLVANAFIDWLGDKTIYHKNWDRSDNRLENLGIKEPRQRLSKPTRLRKDTKKVRVTSNLWIDKVFNSPREAANFLDMHLECLYPSIHQKSLKYFKVWDTLHKCKIEYVQKWFFEKIKDLFN